MFHRPVSSLVLLSSVLALAAGLAVWKGNALQQAEAASLNQPEPAVAVTVAAVRSDVERPTTTAIGTVLALRSITLRNELAGTVREVRLHPGQTVEAGTVLVALDVSVERAELVALEARAALADSTLARLERLIRDHATSETTIDQARATRDVARADIDRVRALIERKTVRAPFRATVGLADLHPGQFLDAGTELTTLQAVANAVHVDFAVPQTVAAGLRRGGRVIVSTGTDEPVEAAIVAVDARVDPRTRNASVRARLTGPASALPAPGASVQVRVPTGPPQPTLVIPATALRKGPEGDHVFVVTETETKQLRAQVRRVEAGAMTGSEVLVTNGLGAGERVATSGSFKLRDGALVAVAAAQTASLGK